MQQPSPSTYLIDDDLEVCRSLAALLATMGVDARSFDSATVFLAELDALPTGVVISDVRMPGLDGIELLCALRDRNRPDPVILVTGDGDVPTAVQALKLGALDFVEKPYEPEVLLASIDRARQQLLGLAGRDLEPRLARLSKREREVFAALIDGATNKHVARELGISPRTVEIYRAKVMQKLEVRTLSQLIRLGVEAELVRSATYPAIATA